MLCNHVPAMQSEPYNLRQNALDVCQGSTVYGEALHIAQAEAPTILEYYEAVAAALNNIPAVATDKAYVVELDPDEEVRTFHFC